MKFANLKTYFNMEHKENTFISFLKVYAALKLEILYLMIGIIRDVST